MSTYTVWSLDVWGHHGSECCPEYGCPCVEGAEHDDNACECHYDVNDRCEVGTVEIEEGDDVLVRLDADGFIHAALCAVDDISDDETIYIESKDLGQPLLQLEVVS